MPHWFRLVTRCREEAIRSLTKPRSSEARPQNPFQKGKKSLRASATSEKLTSDLSNLMSTARRTQARHRATDGMSQVPPDIPKSQNQERWTGKSIIGCHRVNNRVPRFLQDATSLKITIRDQETDCSLHPQLGDEGGRTPQENRLKTRLDECPNQHCQVVYLRTRLHLGIIPDEPNSSHSHQRLSEQLNILYGSLLEDEQNEAPVIFCTTKFFFKERAWNMVNACTCSRDQTTPTSTVSSMSACLTCARWTISGGCDQTARLRMDPRSPGTSRNCALTRQLSLWQTRTSSTESVPQPPLGFF